MYRLEVLGRGWHTIALGRLAVLDEYGYSRLQPYGPYRAYRVRKARKVDAEHLHGGLFRPAREGLYLRI